MVNIGYNYQKGDDFLKRIILLLVLSLLLTTTSIAFASNKIVCKVGSYSTITVPEDWKASATSDTLYAKDPKLTILLQLLVFPATSTIDEDFEELKTQKDANFEVESIKKLSIDNREALRVVLNSHYNKSNIKQYILSYLIYSADHKYMVSFTGKYENFETDLNIIEEIASSIKILK